MENHAAERKHLRAQRYARDLIAQLLNFNKYLGVTTTSLSDGDTTNPITISGESVTATAGDVVTLDSDESEMIFNSLGKWQKFGTLSGLGTLAYKNSASGTYTPTGSVSGSCTPQGSNAEVQLATTSVNSMSSAGSMPTYTVANETLTIGAGSVPTSSAVTVATGAVSQQPTFTGSSTSLSASFSGSEATITVS